MTVTPSPQSVVDWSEYQDDISDAISESIDMDWNANDGAKAVVRWLDENAPYQAPAPSSLAGGEIVDDLAAHLASSIANLGFPVGLGIAPGKTVCTTAAQAIIDTYGHRLAALSPEAPAREGGDSFTTVEARAEAWSDRAEIQHMVEATTGVFAKWSSPEILSRFRQQFMAVIQQAFIEGHDAALTPRHEAPAEGAGEWNPTRGQVINAICNSSPFGPDYKHPDLLRMSDAILALRARSSAPEAREGEAVGYANAEFMRRLKNWRDGVPNSLRADETFLKAVASKSYPVALYTHPAAPSADKLREAMPDLSSVIAWLANRCDPQHAVTELGIYKARIDQALSTPDALKGDAK